jgi:hypothetical protein
MTTIEHHSIPLEPTGSAHSLRRFGELVSAVERLRRRLRRYADKLPDGSPDSASELLRTRIECVLRDEIEPAVRDLEAAQAEILEAVEG